MNRFWHFERRHAWILLGFYLAGVALSLLALLPGSISGHGDTLGRSFAAAFGAFSWFRGHCDKTTHVFS